MIGEPLTAHAVQNAFCALGIANKPLQPVFLHGSFLCTGVPTWNNPRLVVNDDQAADLSRALGKHSAAQMRNVVGKPMKKGGRSC